MGCCARPGMCGHGCWTRTDCDGKRATGRSSAIRRYAASSPWQDRLVSCRQSRHGRCCAATATHGCLPPSAAANSSRLGSRGASAPWSRFATTTAPSASRINGCGCRSPEASPSSGCDWPAHCRIRPRRSARSPCWLTMGDCGWRSLPLCPFTGTALTPTGSRASTLGSSIPTRWSPRTPGCWSRGGRFAPRASCTCATSKPAKPRPPDEHHRPGAAGRGAGDDTGSGFGGPRSGIDAASTKPTIKPPARSSPSPLSIEWAPCWWAIRRASPARTPVECRTAACGSGAATTWCEPYETRPNWWVFELCWWMSAALPPLARSAGSGSPSPGAAGSAVRTAGFRGTGTSWVPTTSPPRPAADTRAPTCRCSSSTVGPASCRHGVTDAATSTTVGGVGPAWPRATHRTLPCPLGVARRTPKPTCWRLARIKQRYPTGQRLLEGALPETAGDVLGALVSRVKIASGSTRSRGRCTAAARRTACTASPGRGPLRPTFALCSPIVHLPSSAASKTVTSVRLGWSGPATGRGPAC
jgi:hypothetical protein